MPVFPECIATKCGDRWYAAGHRLRGDALRQVENEQVAVLLEPKPCRHKKDADNHMAHLRPLQCMPVDLNCSPVLENVIIVSDSTLQLPGVMYGIACELRKIGCNLLWFATKSGAGAQECKKAWEGAPLYHWGLTVANLNDALKHKPPKISPEDITALSDCMTAAHEKCQRSHALFINSARSFPELDPGVYWQLVSTITAHVRSRNVRVFDGKDYVDKIKLADKMHFAAESLEAVVMMILQAIKCMKQGTAQQDCTPANELTLRMDGAGCRQPRKITLAEMWEEGQSDCELQQPDAHDPLGLDGHKPADGRVGFADTGQTTSQDPLGIAHHQEAEKYINVIPRFLQEVDEYREKHGMEKASLTITRELTQLRTTRTPPVLREDDNRFDARRDRLIVCDGCGSGARQASKRKNHL